MTSKNKSTASKTNPAKARDAYISFNKDEWNALQKLGFRERWAYMQFKWLSNFKTGMVGNFRKQRLSYHDIANLVTAPGVQGRGMGNIDDTQAADFLQRLAVVGLVVMHPNRANGGLLFELPLSPIDRKPSALTPQAVALNLQAGPAQIIFPDETPSDSGFFPDGEVPEFDDLPMAMPLSGVSNHSLSVMALTKLKNNTDGARAANADAAPPSRATGAAAALENPHKPPSAAAPLTARDIQAAIAGNWIFTHTDTPEAKTLYSSWADAGITLGDLHAAMKNLDEDPGCLELTPADLTSKLSPGFVQ